MSQVKLFKSILLTLSDSQSNTFLIHKANGQRRQCLRLISEGLWASAAVEPLEGQRHVSEGPCRASITMKDSLLLTLPQATCVTSIAINTTMSSHLHFKNMRHSLIDSIAIVSVYNAVESKMNLGNCIENGIQKYSSHVHLRCWHPVFFFSLQ